jgi:hypothetical protein
MEGKILALPLLVVFIALDFALAGRPGGQHPGGLKCCECGYEKLSNGQEKEECDCRANPKKKCDNPGPGHGHINEESVQGGGGGKGNEACLLYFGTKKGQPNSTAFGRFWYSPIEGAPTTCKLEAKSLPFVFGVDVKKACACTTDWCNCMPVSTDEERLKSSSDLTGHFSHISLFFTLSLVISIYSVFSY